jgi:crotonobetainyl-CoA:carnitine CoA-transferase CaiB-like acyl-CoA transferase
MYVSRDTWKVMTRSADLEWLRTNRQRVERRTDVIRILEGAFSTLTAAEVLSRLETAGVPAGRLRTIDEVYTWDQTALQGAHHRCPTRVARTDPVAWATTPLL